MEPPRRERQDGREARPRRDEGGVREQGRARRRPLRGEEPRPRRSSTRSASPVPFHPGAARYFAEKGLKPRSSRCRRGPRRLALAVAAALAAAGVARSRSAPVTRPRARATRPRRAHRRATPGALAASVRDHVAALDVRSAGDRGVRGRRGGDASCSRRSRARAPRCASTSGITAAGERHAVSRAMPRDRLPRRRRRAAAAAGRRRRALVPRARRPRRPARPRGAARAGGRPGWLRASATVPLACSLQPSGAP